MRNPFDLRGKVVLISGGSGGIGLGMANALAFAGADIVLWDTDEAAGEQARQRLAVHGARVSVARVDVAAEDEVRRGVERVLADFGRVDTAIACAGVLGGEVRFVEASLDAWRRIQAVNAEGAFLFFREVTKHMVARAQAGDPGGSLIGIASIAALEGLPRRQAYSASKGAMLSLMRSLASEHARYGIRANAIAPGMIATNMTAELQSGAAVEQKLLPRIPMRRWGTPEDFGGIAVYLASDASSYHTGDTFVIDGGYVIY